VIFAASLSASPLEGVNLCFLFLLDLPLFRLFRRFLASETEIPRLAQSKDKGENRPRVLYVGAGCAVMVASMCLIRQIADAKLPPL